MTTLLAIDPGPEVSGAVLLDTSEDPPRVIRPWSSISTEALLHLCIDRQHLAGTAWKPIDHLAIEMVSSYGMPVGREVFETVLWIGRMMQAFGAADTSLIYRRDVKLEICGLSRAKDMNIRHALLDLYPRTGGGKTPQVGTKKQPGPLFGMSQHAWPALALGVTWMRERQRTPRQAW